MDDVIVKIRESGVIWKLELSVLVESYLQDYQNEMSVQYVV